MPEDKLNIVKQLEQKYQAIAMIGDGVNDAPALATSTVGIAMAVQALLWHWKRLTLR